MSQYLQIATLGLAVTAPILGAASHAAAQQNTAPKVEQKDFVKKLEDVRQTIERDRNAPRPDTTTDHVIVDICKRNPKLPQCKPNQ